MSDGPTRNLTVDPPDESDRPTQTLPAPPRAAARPLAAFTMTLSSRGGDPVIPGYRILGRLGRGGMGVVYKAIHLPLNRLVAIKMLGGTADDIDPDTRTRFRKEAEALASLRHPNIVPVYEVGEADGLPFFTMELVEGGDLAGRIRSHPPTPPEAARIAAQLARAVEAAHEAGILHRDLKPSNVLLQRTEDRGQRTDVGLSVLCPLSSVLCPKIADFGLAKRFGAARGDDRTMTQAGDILGTPSYMAPEQAEGKGSGSVGPGADIYAVGAILYEMLVGRPPFDAEDAVRTVLQVLNDDPTPPARLSTGIPRDLETICLKCLQKDPRKRYASAGQLADDLERFLEGKPIVARPVSTAERLWKWARRHPSIACLLGTTFLAILAALVGTTTMWTRANDRAQREKEARELADERGRKLEEAALETDFRLARGYVERGLAACQSGDVPRGLTLMSRSLEMVETLRPKSEGPAGKRVDQLDWVVRSNLAAWQSRLVIRQRAVFRHPVPGDHRWVLDFDLSPDGKRVVVGTLDGHLRLFDAETNVEIGPRLQFDGSVFAVAFSPDSRRFVTGRFDKASNQAVARVWNADTREPIGPELPIGHTSGIGPFEFSNVGFVTPELLFVQADDRTVRFFKPGTDEEAAPEIRTNVPITVSMPSPTCDGLITAHVDGSLRRWDPRTGTETARTPAGHGFVFTMACTPDGKRIAAGHWKGTARVRDAGTLEPVGPAITTKAITEAGGEDEWQGFLRAVDLTPDGRTLVTGGGLLARPEKLRGHMQSWDVATGKELYSFPHPKPVWSVATRGDGTQLVSAGEDGSLRVWSAFDGSILARIGQHGNVGKVMIGRDGRSMFVGDMGGDPIPILADLGPSPLAAPAIRLNDVVIDAEYARDGSRLVVATRDGFVQAFDPVTSRPVAPALLVPRSHHGIKLSPDGRTVAVWCTPTKYTPDQPLDIWDLETGSLKFTRVLHGGDAIRFLPDGAMVMIPTYGNDVVCLNSDGQTRWSYHLPGRAANADWPVVCGLGGDGGAVILAESSANTVHVVDPASGRPIGGPLELPGHVQGIAVHPSGKVAVFAFTQGFCQAYDVLTRQRCSPAVALRGRVGDIRFTPDGRALGVLTGDEWKQVLSVVDPVTGLVLGPDVTRPNDEPFGAFAFDPSRGVLAAGDTTGTVRLWNLPAPVTDRAAKVRCWVEMTSRTELVTEPLEILQYLDDRAVGERRKRLREEWGVK
jgi:serine/threonine protein kinase/WD40 repeat protein